MEPEAVAEIVRDGTEGSEMQASERDSVPVPGSRVVLASVLNGAIVGIVSALSVELSLHTVSYLPVWVFLLLLVGSLSGLVSAGLCLAVAWFGSLIRRPSPLFAVIAGVVGYIASWGTFVSTYDADVIVMMAFIGFIGTATLVVVLHFALRDWP